MMWIMIHQPTNVTEFGSKTRVVTVGLSNMQTNRYMQCSCTSLCHLLFLSISVNGELDLVRQTNILLLLATSQETHLFLSNLVQPDLNMHNLNI